MVNIIPGTRLIVCIPTLTNNRRSPNWIDGLTNLQLPLGSSMGRLWIVDETIADARNQLCKKALEVGTDYIFFLGDDVIPPANTILLMLDKIGRTYELDSDGNTARADMITGVYWTKTYPPEPYLFKRNYKGSHKDWKAGEFFPVDLAGCDCLLLDVQALQDVPFPWFSTDWLWSQDQAAPSPIATEDFYFYDKMSKYGKRLFADTAVQCYHEDRETGTLFGLYMDMSQAGGVPIVGDDAVLVADIGSGVSTPPEFFGNNAKVVRFDMKADVKPDVRCDIRAIDPHHFGKYDYVSSSHVLEHFMRSEAPGLVRHWCQLLKPGGKLVIAVPNFEKAVSIIMREQRGDIRYAWAQIFGDQKKDSPANVHKNAFTQRKLEALLQTVEELSDIKVEVRDNGDNLYATATLARPITYPIVEDIVNVKTST